MDLKQDQTQMELDVKIHRPYVIIKERPYHEHAFEIDLGEIRMTNLYHSQKGRFHSCPEKEVHLTSLLIDAKDLSMKYSLDGFLVTNPFDLSVDFAYLSYSPFLGNIDSTCFDKSYSVGMQMKPMFTINLR